MTELLTAAQMRAIERDAIALGGVTGLELMERAGRGVVAAIFQAWPELAVAGQGGAAPPEQLKPIAPSPPGYFKTKEGARRAVVLCGPGNNGGDGFVVARLLKQSGWVVEVFLYGVAGKLAPDARRNLDRWVELGAGQPVSGLSGVSQEVDLVVDALFGTGLTRPLAGEIADWMTGCVAARAACRTVAVDMPSGICSDSGRRLGAAVRADLTVSFQAEKRGHRLADGPSACGKVIVVDIGLAGCDHPGRVRLTTAASLAALGKSGAAHKYDHGHALILSGAAGHSGAARLAARGALRIGAGLVTIGSPAGAMAENAAHLTAIMLRQIGDRVALRDLLKDGRISALCLGPGLGANAATRRMVETALASGRNCVLDADGLSSFSRDPETLFAMLHQKCILTPHGGEFARLFPDIAARLAGTPTRGPAYSKVDATKQAAVRAGCVVVFKGCDTVIAAPDGRCAINAATYERSAPWLATAGAGDVLAGIIAGLLARGFESMQAAETATWLHVQCALNFGPGLIAEDIAKNLPPVLRSLDL